MLAVLPPTSWLALRCAAQSGDHGPINSWDRMPFLNDVAHGPNSPSFDARPTVITRNIIVGNYGASQARPFRVGYPRAPVRPPARAQSPGPSVRSQSRLRSPACAAPLAQSRLRSPTCAVPLA